MVSDAVVATGAILLPNIGGYFSSIPVRKNMAWYATLKKPTYNPPNWVFAPTWTFLYTSIGYSSYLVWKHGGGCTGPAKLPLMVYGGNLLMNLSWTSIFFWKKNLKLSLYEILAVDVTSILTAYLFYQVKPIAGWIFLPYLAWLGLATSLTYSIARDNLPATETATITEMKEE